MLFIRVNELGPRWMWASDACPDPNVICGQPAVGSMIIGVVGGAVVYISSISFFDRVMRQEEPT